MNKTESVTVQLEKIFDEYKAEVQEATNSAITSVSEATVRKLKETSPKRPRGGAYARSWTTKKTGKYAKGENIAGVTVYNAKHYRLTHLLENGHVSRNQFGYYGRVPAIKHIKPVEEWAQTELPAEIERRLK